MMAFCSYPHTSSSQDILAVRRRRLPGPLQVRRQASFGRSHAKRQDWLSRPHFGDTKCRYGARGASYAGVMPNN
eukprot:560322-Rhodomonas_salina.3